MVFSSYHIKQKTSLKQAILIRCTLEKRFVSAATFEGDKVIHICGSFLFRDEKERERVQENVSCFGLYEPYLHF